MGCEKGTDGGHPDLQRAKAALAIGEVVAKECFPKGMDVTGGSIPPEQLPLVIAGIVMAFGDALIKKGRQQPYTSGIQEKLGS